MWILVCGYKRTGKDTLHCILTGRGLKNDEKYYNWCVYSSKGFDVSIFLDHSKSDFSRVAFADGLKEHVRKIYNFLPNDAFDGDKKDEAIDIGGEKKSPRDLLIAHSSDEEWHVKATEKITTSASNFVVTDWRFQREYEHIKAFSNLCTVRVFRKDVPVPSKNVISEHELDKFHTDVLLLPEGTDELERCLELFPQYKDFVCRGTIPMRSNQTSTHEEQQYLDLLKDIIGHGYRKDNRTGVGTKSIFGIQMRFNLRHSFPLFTTRRLYFKNPVQEILWCVAGDTNSKHLSDKDVHIWDTYGSKSYMEENGFPNREEGDLGPLYGFQWRHFGAEYTDMNADYRGKGIDQLSKVIDTIKKDPNDRRMIITVWNPADTPKMVIPSCITQLQFYVANGELSCMLHQRSADMALGVPNDVASYALLTYMIAHVCSLKPGDLVHSIGDAHVYLNHIQGVETQINREPRPFPTLEIKRTVESIEAFTMEDFNLINYSHHPHIRYESN